MHVWFWWHCCSLQTPSRAAVPQSHVHACLGPRGLPGSPRAAWHQALSRFQIVAQVIGKNAI